MNKRDRPILVISVGGACAPILSAIRAYLPGYIYFVASSGDGGSQENVDGQGNPCGDRRKFRCPDCGATHFIGNPDGPAIANQLALTGGQDYDIITLDEPDSLSDCYQIMMGEFARIRERFAGRSVIVDYTGGTKTMSVALSVAALEHDFSLALVKGTRVDKQRVLDGTEVASLVNANDVIAERRMEEAMSLFNRFEYQAASKILEEAARSAPLPAQMQRRVREFIAIARGFEAWDKFDHQSAKKLLSPHRELYVQNWILLDKITKSGWPNLLLVGDLLRNSERKAALGFYDDAVARLYRTLELAAQIRLAGMDPPLDTSRLDSESLPVTIRDQYKADGADGAGRVKLGLSRAYQLLQDLGDPIGELFTDQLLDVLSTRNESILAHGFVPVQRVDYEKIAEIVDQVVGQVFELFGEKNYFIQFPLYRGGVITSRQEDDPGKSQIE